MKSLNILIFIIFVLSLVHLKKIDQNSLASNVINEYFGKENKNVIYKDIPKRYSSLQNIEDQKFQIYEQLKDSTVYEVNPTQYNANKLIIDPISQNNYLLTKNSIDGNPLNNINNYQQYENFMRNQNINLNNPNFLNNNIPNNNLYNSNYLSYQFPNNSTMNFNNTNQLGGKISKNALDSLNSVFNKVDYAISQIQEAKFLAEENLKNYEKIEKDHEKKLSKLEEKIAKKEDQLLSLSSSLKINKEKKSNKNTKQNSNKKSKDEINNDGKEDNNDKNKNEKNSEKNKKTKSENEQKKENTSEEKNHFPFLSCIKKILISNNDVVKKAFNKCRRKDDIKKNIIT